MAVFYEKEIKNKIYPNGSTDGTFQIHYAGMNGLGADKEVYRFQGSECHLSNV